ncbi:uncharacterized protein N7529_003257 [Penicillium soppii]|jgi:hypothetical protein|uniref:uncharacterized protein n=1 Tax=Penicillium soppii TaxID=69789 RepID=UPI002547E4F8|nr:uncharacterized protein N7529_003257 [Penicillium soppii]KAJ5874827.1 hypothetical protein N7529_003257 [Penicillium soppii]
MEAQQRGSTGEEKKKKKKKKERKRMREEVTHFSWKVAWAKAGAEVKVSTSLPHFTHIVPFTPMLLGLYRTRS